MHNFCEVRAPEGIVNGVRHLGLDGISHSKSLPVIHGAFHWQNMFVISDLLEALYRVKKSLSQKNFISPLIILSGCLSSSPANNYDTIAPSTTTAVIGQLRLHTTWSRGMSTTFTGSSLSFNKTANLWFSFRGDLPESQHATNTANALVPHVVLLLLP